MHRDGHNRTSLLYVIIGHNIIILIIHTVTVLALFRYVRKSPQRTVSSYTLLLYNPDRLNAAMQSPLFSSVKTIPRQ